MADGVIWVQATACLSILGCVVILVLYHGNSKIQQKKINALVSTIALCDLFAALGVCIGEPRDGSPWCWIQSTMTSYFPLVSVFLTTLIAYVLYQLVCHNKHITDFPRVVYYMCWGIPFVLVLLPLSTNRYGNPGSDRGWCFLDHRSHMPKWTLVFWIIVSFYLWFYLAVITYLILLWFISYRVFHIYGAHAQATSGRENQRGRSRIFRSLMRLIWYPLIIIVCWLPSASYDVNEALNGGDHHSSLFRGPVSALNMFPAAQGLLTSIAFICTNQDVRSIVFGIKEPLLSPSTSNRSPRLSTTIADITGGPAVTISRGDTALEKPGSGGILIGQGPAVSSDISSSSLSGTAKSSSTTSTSTARGDPASWPSRRAYTSEDSDYSSDDGF